MIKYQKNTIKIIRNSQMEVNKVLAEERFREILKLVEEHKTITVQELTELLDTSESTIRRDLTTLHKKGKLIKVHGGATAVNMAQYTRDESVAVRQDLNIDEKVQIGKYAAALIEKDDFVYEEGERVIERMYASEVFQAAGAELVPLIYCNTLPNGIVKKEAYEFYAGRILKILSQGLKT